ncbi:heme oxygenase 1 [Chironomus tepperi]|uniref:heme oxygenase 1 n=1 Tax=Chironomus tepperi TaxID=113505 RepID=UPI00391F3BA1
MEGSITKRMRDHTRNIHKVSDDLVNAKLAFALNNNSVWADGLLVFYEVFKFLEENVPSSILPPEYHRTQQFEDDLKFFKGSDWEKTYKPRESVVKYIKHLNHVKETNSLLLIAYVYHLYMGLLSGGQILAKKRQITKKFSWNKEQRDESEEFIEPGTSLTSFPNQSIVQLKNNMRSVIDNYVKDLDEVIKQQLVVESQKVFELNNEIIRSVEGVTKQNLKLLGYILLIILSFYIIMKMWSI